MPATLDDVLESTECKLLATNLGNTEGPLWHPGGYLTLVDVRGSRLWKYDPQTGQTSLLRTETGEGNGCAFDRQGRLVMCEGGDHRRISAMDRSGVVVTLTDNYQGKRYNKPNDVVCRKSDGSIYFTDPELRLDKSLREIGFAAVYRIAPDGSVHLATKFVYPNGLAFSPDEKTLYVALSRAEEADLGREERGEFCPNRKIYAYDVAPDGSLSRERMFADMASSAKGVPDGMKVDSLGRVFCVGSGGVWVFEPDGTKIGVLPVTEVPRNVAFGGPDFRTLYMTPGTSLYSMRLKHPGISPY